MLLLFMICGVVDWILVNSLYVILRIDGDWGKGIEGLLNGVLLLK